MSKKILISLNLICFLIFSSCFNSNKEEKQKFDIPSSLLNVNLEESILDTVKGNSNQKLNGLAIAIDIGSSSLHPLHWDLPQEIRAVNALSISTIIYIEAKIQFDNNRQVGPSILPFYRRSWRVLLATILDGKPSVVYMHTFIGESLRKNISQYAYGIGMDTDGEVALYRPNSVTNPRNITREKDAELIFGNNGGAKLKNGKYLIGIVGAPPQQEAINWILDPEKWLAGSKID